MRRIVRQYDRLVPEVGDSCRIVGLNLWIGRSVGSAGECQCVVGDEDLPFLYSFLHPVRQYPQVSARFGDGFSVRYFRIAL